MDWRRLGRHWRQPDVGSLVICAMVVSPLEQRRLDLGTLVLRSLVVGALVVGALVLGALVQRGLGLGRVAGRRQAFSAERLTLAVAVVLSGLAAVIGFTAGSGPIVVLKLPDALICGLLTVLFFIAEYSLLNVEFRRDAHSLTLAGVPMALAVLLAPAHTAVLVRVVGALAALLLQRIDWEKLVFNIASYAFEIAVSSALARLLVGENAHLGPGAFALVLMVVVTVDQGMSALVLWIIRLHGGVLGRRQAVGVLSMSFALSVMTSAFATTIVVLVGRAGPLGIELVVLVTLVATVAYRGYAATQRRHQSLELMHSFVAEGVGVPNPSTHSSNNS